MVNFYNSEGSTPIAEPGFKRDLYVCKWRAKAMELVGIRILAGQESHSHIKEQYLPSVIQKYCSHNSMCWARVSSVGCMAITKEKSQSLGAYFLNGGGSRDEENEGRSDNKQE